MFNIRIFILTALLSIFYIATYCSKDSLSRQQKDSIENDLNYNKILEKKMDKIEKRLIDDELNELLADYNFDTTECIKQLFKFQIDSIIDKHLLWYSEMAIDNAIIYKEVESVFVSQKLKALSWIVILYYEISLEENDIVIFNSTKKNRIFDYHSEWLTDSGYIPKYGEKEEEKGGFIIRTRKGDGPLHYFKDQDSDLLKLETKFDNWINKLEIYGLEYLKMNKIAPLTKDEFDIQ